ncbi:JmjC domain protein [Ancylostoma ceylanicum]|uniref:JmjC domain protein n=1 Tax=Ancylostoma ceylanicum TaxID=53326 RepID=A0A0D6LG93_9BILA|nr:JmjC domain protein [Ancylostoma ceylanicum]
MTLYADGGEIPFPHRRSHPPHIPTGPPGFEVFTFYPTYDEFKDFKSYIQKIEAVGAHRRSGICKIVAPDGWTPRPSKKKFNYRDEAVEHFLIQSPVKESIQRQSFALLKTNHVYKKAMTAAEFRKLATSTKYRNPRPELQGKALEDHYFQNMLNSQPIYGADTEGSFYDEDVDEFNMKRLGTILDETKEATGGKVIRGVTSVYLYFGMYGASFAWHVEDMELYSINYLHHGAPKYWFAVPPEAATRFERLMRQQFPTYDRQCKGYHMGFNLGYNIAESTNFATDRWIDFGKNAVLCKCRSDMVEIDMTPFMQKYRHDDFERWYSYWYLPKTTPVIDVSQCRRKKRKDEHISSLCSDVSAKRRRNTYEDFIGK